MHLLVGSPASVKFCNVSQPRVQNMVKYVVQMCFADGPGHGPYIYFLCINLNFRICGFKYCTFSLVTLRL